MKTATLSIRLDKDLDRLLGKASRQTGRNRSEVAGTPSAASCGSRSLRPSAAG